MKQRNQVEKYVTENPLVQIFMTAQKGYLEGSEGVNYYGGRSKAGLQYVPKTGLQDFLQYVKIANS